MNMITANFLRALKLGTPVTHCQISLVPLLQLDPSYGPPYLTLHEALASRQLSITEVSESGRVPELCVTNNAEIPVLILDGEQLIGAKQNRVLNTTILVAAKCRTTVPVSCVEQGRWSRSSRYFDDAEIVMARKARARKMSAVSASRKFAGSYAGNQGMVWEDVREMCDTLNVDSATEAMHDAFMARRKVTQDWLKRLVCQPDQVGFIFLKDGQPLAMEAVSRPAAYQHLHERLIRSYTVDLDPKESLSPAADPLAAAAAFVAQVQDLQEDSAQPSCGLGMDHRFDTDRIAGIALVFEDACIHAVFLDLRDTGSQASRYHDKVDLAPPIYRPYRRRL